MAFFAHQKAIFSYQKLIKEKKSQKKVKKKRTKRPFRGAKRPFLRIPTTNRRHFRPICDFSVKKNGKNRRFEGQKWVFWWF
jgi:hypothetical protein